MTITKIERCDGYALLDVNGKYHEVMDFYHLLSQLGVDPSWVAEPTETDGQISGCISVSV